MLESATPLFLIGCPRSGTTFTARLLNSHPEILMTNETAVFLLLDDIIRKSRTGIEAGILYGKDYHLLLGELLETNYREMIQVFYEKIAHTENRTRLAYWGEKHPHMTMCLDRVEHMFPDARYIYLVRDPRDTAASIAKMRNVSFMEALNNWKVFSDLYEAFVPRLPADRLLLVRYETLVANYEGEAARMLQWLGVPTTPEVEEFLSNYKNADAHSMATGKDFATESVGRWASIIEEKQRAA
ncbi:MAG TPA: sulfotransferase, partial [Acetobacteraceae bacterium]|nr:sulfotransferase [Acetobacteraceae bacterium]